MAFLLGESDEPLPGTAAHAEEEKPVRLLHDWAVFDARPSKAKADGGALALALISLHALGDTLDGIDVGCAPEGAGAASPYRENEEDAGQEDDGGYDDDEGCGGCDEEEASTVSVRLRLGAILRYTLDYTKRDEYVLIPPLSSALLWALRGGADIIVLGCAARSTSRRPRLGISSALLRQSIAGFSRRSSARTKSHRPLCARSCTTRTPLSTHLLSSSSLWTG